MDFVGIFISLLMLLLTGYGLIIVIFTLGLIKTAAGTTGRNKYDIRKTSHHYKNALSHPQIVTSSNCHILTSSHPQIPTSVSVIIPVRNEKDHIVRILEEIRNQHFPVGQMEVIISDDFSEDHTMEFAGQFAKHYPGFPLVLLPSDNAQRHKTGKKQAIERAVEIAGGEILLLTDADTFHGPDWISSMAEGFSSKGKQMILGPVYFTHAKNLLQKMQTLEFSALMGITAGSANIGYPVMCNGANLAYRRGAFNETGGFHGNLQYKSGDDQFILSSINRHYMKGAISFNFDHSAIVGTEPESTLFGFLQQRIRWVSKSPGYRDPPMIITGFITFMFSITLFCGFFLGFFFTRLFFATFLIWLLKILLEYPMVSRMMRFFRKQELLELYFFAQVFQLFYVPVVGILGLIVPYRWKGRKGVR